MFEHVIGQEDIKSYFLKAVTNNHLAHSYIFEGASGIGKKTLALALAKALLCETKEVVGACGKCKACHMVESMTHPDLIVVNKDTKVTKIDTIRDKVVKEMDIKPYQGEYKIIILTEADTITTEGQNAMLKTIEEPPHYGVIILISENIAKLLPTIQSRAIKMRFNPLTTTQIETFLQQYPLESEVLGIYANFSEGSIGTAKKLLTEEGFLERRKESINYLNRLEEANLMQMYDLVKDLLDQKDYLEEIFDFWLLWYRDISMVKSIDSKNLYYKDYEKQLLDIAYKLPYNKISLNIDSIKEAKQIISQNIYSTFVIENLLFKLKERKK